MTMPTLLNSTQGAQYKTAYKKALSVLNQAVVMNVALDDYDLTQATETDTTKATDGTSASLYNLFNKRMNVAKVCIGTCSDGLSWGVDGFANQSNALNHPFGKAANYTFFFNDGIVLTFPKSNYVGGQSCTLNQNKNYWCRGVIDVNGKKNPNKLITCDAGTEGDNCQVSNPTDVYPILLHDQTIEPATQAAKVVMYGGK